MKYFLSLKVGKDILFGFFGKFLVCLNLFLTTLSITIALLLENNQSQKGTLRHYNFFKLYNTQMMRELNISGLSLSNSLH